MSEQADSLLRTWRRRPTTAEAAQIEWVADHLEAVNKCLETLLDQTYNAGFLDGANAMETKILARQKESHAQSVEESQRIGWEGVNHPIRG